MNTIAAALLGASLAASAPSAREPRSIVLIVVDALRPDRLTPYGAPRDTSPRIARLAKEGTLFKRAFAQSNWTLPSLASVMTGLYPSTHRAVHFPASSDWAKKLAAGRFVPLGAERLDPSRITLAERLAERGYRTAAVVSGGFCRSEFGFGQGFEEYHNMGSRLGVILGLIRNVLGREHGRPYFLYLHLSDVHDPYEPPPPFDRLWTDPGYRGPMDGSRAALARARQGGRVSREDIDQLLGLYDGAIREMDERLAELLDAIGPEAVVVLTSDHGESFGEHGRLQHASDAYDEQLRVPLIIRAPGRGAGRVVEPVVELVDIAPTILELAGAPPARGLHGRSLAPLLDGGRWRERPAFIEAAMENSGGPASPFGAVVLRSRDRKFIRSLAGKPDELYDLAADPGETKNLASERPEEAARWRALADARLAAARRASASLPPVDPRAVDLDPGLREKLRAAGYLR